MFGSNKKENRSNVQDVSASTPTSTISLDQNTDQLVSALYGSNFGFAIWDPDLNLITANPRYADIHKVRSDFLTPGINAETIMVDLKDRGILSANANPSNLAKYISDKLKTTGTMVSHTSFVDGTILEVTADLLPDGNIVTFLRDASHEKNREQEFTARDNQLEAFATALGDMRHMMTMASPLDEVTRTVGNLLNIDRCSIWVGDLEAGTSRTVSHFDVEVGKKAEALEFSLQTMEAFNSYLHNSSVLAIDDVKNHMLGLELSDDRSYGETVKAFLAVPIIVDNQPIALLSCVALHQPRTWKAEEKIFATAIAGQLSPMIKLALDS